MPHVLMIADPNGAGKTTSAPFIFHQVLKISHFLNADTIAQGLSGFEPEKVAFQAGRIMIAKMHELADKQEDFSFETTLASRSFAHWIRQLKQKGYHFHLTFLFLDSAELAISRVAERVKMGGHFVPEDVIRRRYESGLRNFFPIYKEIADSWEMIDNSNLNCLKLIACHEKNEFFINETIIWHKIKEKYNVGS